MGKQMDALAEAGTIKARFGFFSSLVCASVLITVGTIMTLRKPPSMTRAPGDPPEVDKKARNTRLAVVIGIGACGVLVSWLIWQGTKKSKKFAAFQGFT